MEKSPFVSIENVSKHFGGTAALSEVSLDIEAGEVHGLLGENGAGKSTLMKVLSGMVSPDNGRVAIDGHELRLGHPDASRRAGLTMAYQELSSPGNITVAVRLALPDLPRGRTGLVSTRIMRSAAEEKLNQWGMANLNPDSLMADLNLADRQHVEIVSALSREPKLLVLDEPTAALPDPEWLYRQIAIVTGRGTSVIYISHKLAEIRALCDHGTVLRNGKVVGSFTKGEMDEQELIQLMIGRSFVQAFPTKRPATDEVRPLLEVRNLVALPRLNGVDLSLGRSEVVGVAGLEGQGQRELFYALAGLVSSTDGDVKLHEAADERPRKERRFSAKRTDFVLVPEERKTEALFMQMGTRYNLTISRVKEFRRWLYVSRSAERKFALAAATRVNMTAAALEKPVVALSGGNQQKVVFGRSLLSKPRCLLLFDPTRGVDAATKMDIYRMIRNYAEGGDGVLIYSTEIPELVGLCDRVYTIYNGKIQAELSGDQITEKALMNSALGRQREDSLL